MTPTGFDPYSRWLGIPLAEQPPDHYRLLGLRRFESAQRVIEAAADDQMDVIYRHRSGPYGALARKLLNDLAAAKVCLCNAELKAAYDAALRGTLAANAGPPTGDVGPPSQPGWKPAPLRLNDNPTPRFDPPSASFTFPPHSSRLMPPGKRAASDEPTDDAAESEPSASPAGYEAAAPSPSEAPPIETSREPEVLMELDEYEEAKPVPAGDHTLDYHPGPEASPLRPAPPATRSPSPGPSSDLYAFSGSSVSATPSTFSPAAPAPVMPAPVTPAPATPAMPLPLPTAIPVAAAIPVARPVAAPVESAPEEDDDSSELSELARRRPSAVERARAHDRSGAGSAVVFLLQIIIGGVLGAAAGFYILQKVRSGEWKIPYVNVPAAKSSDGTFNPN